MFGPSCMFNIYFFVLKYVAIPWTNLNSRICYLRRSGSRSWIWAMRGMLRALVGCSGTDLVRTFRPGNAQGFLVFAASQLMSCHSFQSNHVGLIGSKSPWFHLLVWSCVAHCELFLLVLLLLLVWIVLSKTKGARLTLRNEKDQETLMQHEQSRLVKIHTTKPINLRFCPLGYVFSYRGNTV